MKSGLLLVRTAHTWRRTNARFLILNAAVLLVHVACSVSRLVVRVNVHQLVHLVRVVACSHEASVLFGHSAMHFRTPVVSNQRAHVNWLALVASVCHSTLSLERHPCVISMLLDAGATLAHLGIELLLNPSVDLVEVLVSETDAALRGRSASKSKFFEVFMR